MEYQRTNGHSVSRLSAHIVWITKYRKRILSGFVAERVREIIRGICKEHEVEILKGHISQYHVHLFVSVSPHLSLSKIVQYLKGKSSYKMLRENRQLSKMYCGRYLYGRGYFVATSGNITDEIIMEYISNQDDNESNDEFSISQS